MEAKQNIVEKFFSHQGNGIFIHLENSTLKPKDLIDIYNDERFQINHTEYQIFGMLLFQKIENHVLLGDFSINNIFPLIQKISIDLGLYYGSDGNNQDEINKSYEEIQFRLDSRNLNFEKVLSLAAGDIIKTMDKVEEIMEDKNSAKLLKKVFLSPLENFQKLIE